MKRLACILGIFWSLLIIQPLFGNYMTDIVASSCSQEKPAAPSCSMTACHKPKEAENKKDMPCRDNGCNPTLSCPTGNFYVNNSILIISSPEIPGQKFLPANDNRIQEQLSECWHPPESV